MAKKHMLKHKGNSKKKQGNSGTKAYKAENQKIKERVIKDRGPGSSYANALFRSEAQRLRDERKIPGNLGYKETIDVGPHVLNNSLNKSQKKKK